jgi:hypothetical protein
MQAMTVVPVHAMTVDAAGTTAISHAHGAGAPA